MTIQKTWSSRQIAEAAANRRKRDDEDQSWSPYVAQNKAKLRAGKDKVQKQYTSKDKIPTVGVKPRGIRNSYLNGQLQGKKV